MSKLNKEMRKAVIQTTLETNTLKNKPDYIKNFIQSNRKLKGRNIIKNVISKK
tara:strand:- start:182 stop:340 length:159 start_codon:yes stop_codon:yes gene_type:complete